MPKIQAKQKFRKFCPNIDNSVFFYSPYSLYLRICKTTRKFLEFEVIFAKFSQIQKLEKYVQ